MSGGILSRPVELDDCDRDLRVITKHFAELSKPMTPTERRASVWREEQASNRVVDRIVYGGALVGFVIVIGVACWRAWS